MALGHVFLDRFGRGGDAGFVRARLGWHSDVHSWFLLDFLFDDRLADEARRLATATATANASL
jgi:hypothetical protein